MKIHRFLGHNDILKCSLWGETLLNKFITAVVFLFCHSLFADIPQWEEFRSQYLSQKHDKAEDTLVEINDDLINEDLKAMKYFALGRLYLDQSKTEKAIEALKKSVEFKGHLQNYSNYYLGKILFENKGWKEAEPYLSAARKGHLPRNLYYEIRKIYGDKNFDKKKWYSAYKDYKYVERKWRSDVRHPEVVYKLVRTEIKRKRYWRACYWMKKMYSKYPTHKLVNHWGFDLSEVSVDDTQPKCDASKTYQLSRIKRLIWTGFSARAREEIETLKVTNEKSKYYKDYLLANYYMRSGYVTEATQLMLNYFDKKNKDYEYLTLMAKLSSLMDKNAESVGLYYRAHEVFRHSYKGRKALFYAGFQAYHYQDYDSAVKLFKEFIQKYKKSGLARDSKWYIAWIDYLRGNYKDSVKELKRIIAQKKTRWGKRRWRDHDAEKLNYWLAMGLMKLGKKQEANSFFNNVIASNSVGYYSVLSQQRLKQLDFVPMNLTQTSAARDIASLENEALPINDESVHPTEVAQEEESEEILKSEEDSPEYFYNRILEVGENTKDSDESVYVTSFRDPRLGYRFDRTKELLQLGFNDLARWELYEIERRTSNSGYLRSLMGSYQAIGSYHRSAYIAQVNFGQQREVHGINGVRYLWEYAFPQAYKDHVDSIAKQFEFDKIMIWSIIRAESFYRHDAESPVGANGLMQLMPFTAKRVAQLVDIDDFKVKDLLKPEVNIKLGTRYLKRLSHKFNKNYLLAAAGYNAGPHRVEQWLHDFGKLNMDEFIEHIPFVETRNYAKKVMYHYNVYNQLYNTQNTLMDVSFLTKPVGIRINVPNKMEDWSDI